MRRFDLRRGPQADEWKLGHESVPGWVCAVVVPADQPAQDSADYRHEVAVALLVVGEDCFGLG